MKCKAKVWFFYPKPSACRFLNFPKYHLLIWIWLARANLFAILVLPNKWKKLIGMMHKEVIVCQLQSWWCLYHPGDTFCFRTKGGLSLSKICFCFCFVFLGGGKGGGRGGLVFLFQLPWLSQLIITHVLCLFLKLLWFMETELLFLFFIFYLFILTLYSN